MTTMYSTLVYAQASPGSPYTAPAVPSTFVSQYAVSSTWNPYSANDIDRTTYWVDTAGTLTLDQVQLALYGLSGVQQQQIDTLYAAYQTACTANVSYTSEGGVTQTFQADPGSQNDVLVTIAGCTKTGATPSGFYWVAADNTQVPFTFADLNGLAAAMFAQGAVAFQHLQTQKAAVRAATTVLAVQAITW